MLLLKNLQVNNFCCSQNSSHVDLLIIFFGSCSSGCEYASGDENKNTRQTVKLKAELLKQLEDKKEKLKLLQQYHNSSTFQHQGITKTLKL